MKKRLGFGLAVVAMLAMLAVAWFREESRAEPQSFPDDTAAE